MWWRCSGAGRRCGGPPTVARRYDGVRSVTNEAGQLVITYKIFRCWVSEFQSMADLDANANAVLIQHIKLENEGWERDYEVPEPTEPTFTEPA